MNTAHQKTLRLVQCALIAALAYIGFQFLRIDIPVGESRTAVHMGNAVVVLGALLVGGGWGGAAGAVGLTIADLTSGYVTSAPKTFLLKLIIGLIAGLVSGRLLHIRRHRTEAAQARIAAAAAAASLGCNVVLDPVVGYFYKMYILGVPQDWASTMAKISSVSTLVNAVVSAVLVILLWPVLYAALQRAGLLPWADTEPSRGNV